MRDLFRMVFDEDGRLTVEMAEDFYNELKQALPGAQVQGGVARVHIGKAGSGNKLSARGHVTTRSHAQPFTIFAVSDDPECYP